MNEKEWEYGSLKWIHEAREKHYFREQGLYGNMSSEISPEAQNIMERLKLPVSDIVPLSGNIEKV